MRVIKNKKLADTVKYLLIIYPQHINADVYAIADMIEQYWNEHGSENLFYELRDGALFINMKCCGRFAPLPPKAWGWNEKEYYTEGSILQKGESEYD